MTAPSRSADAPPATLPATGLHDQLCAIVGEDHVLATLDARQFFSTDMFTSGVTAELVVAPATTSEVAAVVGLCTANGRAVIPRGAGFSYTSGYIPVCAETVIVDLRRLNAIVEINAEDRYIIVECGCTWSAVYDALKAKGLRTPYFGPMSGFRSTVGGALSQGSFFLGSTQYGATADSVLGLEVVLADGSVVVTGSSSSISPAPSGFRHYGPDLTGLFLGDSGALGFKTLATLKLIPFPAAQRFATFGFADPAAAVRALSDIARAGVAAEAYIWDPAFAASLRSRNSLMDDIRYLGGVAGGAGMWRGLVNASRLALAGKSLFDTEDHLLHVTIDDVCDAGAAGRLELVKAFAHRYGGRAAEPSAPMALRGRPFNDFVPVAEASAAQRNLPTHGIFPHSSLAAVCAEVADFFTRNSDRMAEHGISHGTIMFAIGAQVVCLEPLFYWSDTQLAAFSRLRDRTDLEALEGTPERPLATQVVSELRRALVDIFSRHGASHCQIGKAYPYRQTRQPEAYSLLQCLKRAVDSKGLVNPGALGLAERPQT